MSESEDVEVIQGRLGLESGDVSEASVDELQPHPQNEAIYGDTTPDDLDETFVESVREKGVLEPLVITADKRIISGHRRWQAARETDTDRVPVRISEFDSELAEREAVIEFNRQREKTPGQIVNEFEEILEIEQERAERERKQKISQTNSNKSETREEFPTSQNDNNRAREKAAEKVNADVSGRTLDKGLEVKEKAEQGDETAQQAWDKLRDGEESFNGAYSEVKNAEEEREKEQKQQSRAEQYRQAIEEDEAVEVYTGEFASVAGDELGTESVDHIVTDPPYGEDALEAWRELGEVAARVLKPGGFCAAYSGKYHFPAVMDALGESLEYYWQAVLIHDDPGAKFFARKMRTNYKPVLIYAKPPVEAQEDFITDVIQGAGREKDDHEWQQAEAEAAELLERFTNTNDRILDPMCGSGTVGVACRRLNRRCVLIDQDPDAVATARRRVVDES